MVGQTASESEGSHYRHQRQSSFQSSRFDSRLANLFQSIIKEIVPGFAAAFEIDENFETKLKFSSRNETNRVSLDIIGIIDQKTSFCKNNSLVLQRNQRNSHLLNPVMPHKTFSL